VDSVKELKANQKYEKVVKEVKKTEEKLFVLREKKRQLAANIHDKFHEPNVVLIAGN
jgi:flagellar biosynthesis chaperone FliJ